MAKSSQLFNLAPTKHGLRHVSDVYPRIPCTLCSCFLGCNALLMVLLAITLNKPLAFLFCVNRCFDILNFMDGTPAEKLLNAYAGTPNEEFFHPLREEEIAVYHDVPVTMGQIPAAFEGGVLFRIGSNQRYPTRSHVHAFEGDAMLHAFKFNPRNNSISVGSGSNL